MTLEVLAGGIASVIALVVGYLWKFKPFVSAAKADSAANEAEAAMYLRLRSDIDALSGDVHRLRAELDRERTHCRNLEQYVWQLQGLMRHAGIEPPPMPAYPALVS
jgi:hypothetical protein